MGTVAEAANRLERSIPVQQAWISVEDRLPEKYEEVLVFALYGRSWRPMIGWLGDFFEDKEWHVLTSQGEFCPSDVTHWMPLPEPPKEETGHV